MVVPEHKRNQHNPDLSATQMNRLQYMYWVRVFIQCISHNNKKRNEDEEQDVNER